MSAVVPQETAWNIHLDEATHEYTVDGRPVPGVTRVLDEALQEYRGIDPAVLRAAQERGTAVHRACELYDLRQLDFSSLDPALVPYLEAYITFRSDTDFEPEAVEEAVYHPRFGYCGTLDRRGRARISKRRMLIDIKSAEQVPASTGPQTAAYEDALRASGRIGDKESIERYALRLTSDGKYKLIRLANLGDLNVFLAALTIYRWRRQ